MSPGPLGPWNPPPTASGAVAAQRAGNCAVCTVSTATPRRTGADQAYVRRVLGATDLGAGGEQARRRDSRVGVCTVRSRMSSPAACTVALSVSLG